VTVFVFDASLLPKQSGGEVMQTVINSRPVYVGSSHGYTVAISERDGVGYAVASDLPTQDTIRIVARADLQ
jgi:hypothetical protein